MYVEWAPRAIFNANLHDNLMAAVRPVVLTFLSMQSSIFQQNRGINKAYSYPKLSHWFFQKFKSLNSAPVLILSHWVATAS